MVDGYINQRIRLITPSGAVSTFAGNSISITASNTNANTLIDGVGTVASFYSPWGITVDQISGNMYVADVSNQAIRMITPSGNVTTLAGGGGTWLRNGRLPGYQDGQGTNAIFSGPSAVALDANGNVFVVDNGNNCIRMVSPNGTVTTVAGHDGFSGIGYVDSTGTSAKFIYPSGISIDPSGNLYVGGTLPSHRPIEA